VECFVVPLVGHGPPAEKRWDRRTDTRTLTAASLRPPHTVLLCCLMRIKWRWWWLTMIIEQLHEYYMDNFLRQICCENHFHWRKNGRRLFSTNEETRNRYIKQKQLRGREILRRCVNNAARYIARARHDLVLYLIYWVLTYSYSRLFSFHAIHFWFAVPCGTAGMGAGTFQKVVRLELKNERSRREDWGAEGA